MPSRLRPKAPVAADAILVGDPGRSLLLAQELLQAPRMSNHARGLWGYSGETVAGRPLTIQATGMGGPSAAAVLADLAELGVRHAIRVGTCAGLGDEAELGELLIVDEALAGGGSATSFGLKAGGRASPDAGLRRRLASRLAGEAREATIVSFDSPFAGASTAPSGAVAADMQTVAVLARAEQLGIAAAAVLIVSERADEGTLTDDALEAAAKRSGHAASDAFSP